MHQTVLFTSVYFKGYAGSELATLEQAKSFLNRGDWDVYIFTLVKGGPLLECADEMTVLTPEELELAPNRYDLLISRQYPLLDYLLFSCGIKADRVYYEAVGYKYAWDAFPIYYKDLTMNGAVSKLAANKLRELGFDTSDAYIYPNSAPREYFASSPDREGKLSKIAIVSNHVPNELREFARIADANGLKVDIYGKDDTYTLVTADLLSGYDAVISIGKTAYYALAEGLPIYMYDNNVSEGYVTLNNYQLNLESNFAKKDTYCAKSPDDIYSEIVSGWSAAVDNAESLRRRARHDFSSDELLERFLSVIEDRPEMDYERLFAEWPTLAFTSNLYVDEFVTREEQYSKLENYLRDEIRRHFALMQEHARLEMNAARLDEENNRLNARVEELSRGLGYKLKKRAKSIIRKAAFH